MNRIYRASSLGPHLPLRYVGGDPSLDLVNTVAWGEHGPRAERLTDFGRLVRWAHSAGTISATRREALLEEGARRPAAAEEALETAWRLRRVLKDLFDSVVADVASPSALEAMNAFLAEALDQLQLEYTDIRKVGVGALDWRWRIRDGDLKALLRPTVWAAAHLLTSSETQRIRTCARHGCGWLFIDRSRNHMRRWCEMKTCGTQEKSRRRAKRRQAIAESKARESG